MNKKGDISITIIIGAAIALIVLIVVVTIFAGYFSGYLGNVEKTNTIKNCDEYTGYSWKTKCDSTYSRIYIVGDSNDHPNQFCCSDVEQTTNVKNKVDSVNEKAKATQNLNLK